ncbi:MAG: 50S ribosomal protein L9 [Candidatus Azambacteria bacterium]|nr:50S ribosomal protein L9 [Candidatus Azambacteria bacterium]
MRIVLLKDALDLGKKGDIKDVSDGYGRNFLIRNKLAEILTPQVARRLEIEKEKEEKTAVALKSQTLALKEKIEKLKLVLKTKIGESGQVFGSVTPTKILAELEKNGIKLEKNQLLSKPIKTLGESKIKIKLPQEIEAELQIIIEP